VLNAILSAAILVTFVTSVGIVLAWGGRRVQGPLPLSLLGFMALLFTAGLDVGLIMLPLTEFPVYSREPVYAFANPLAIAFGSWGFLVWGFYFLTTFYFLAVEPHVRVFELPPVKLVNNVVIIGTSAFTAHLLWRNLPFYVPEIGAAARYGVVALTVLMSVLTSTHLRYVRVLSVWSMWTFGALVAAMWLASGMGVSGFLGSVANIGEYFTNLPRFVIPMSDYHAFYLFWWFSWSIMIGQFVSRFVGGMRTWHLAAALLLIPSIPLAAWFAVLYFYYRAGVPVHPVLAVAMVVVGIIFVVNSIDSLIRLYSDNLGLTARRMGEGSYVVTHWTLMYALVLAFQFTPLKIEWIGLVVIGIYAAVYVLLLRRAATGAWRPAGPITERPSP
jgi:choline-glycine betaine transporter